MQKNSLIARLIVLFSFITLSTLAQAPSQGNINQLIEKISNHNIAMPPEKVFMQFDKPYYSTGDTIWFKGYVVDEAIKYSTLSSRLYIELLNDSNAVVKRFVFPVSYGITWGNIPLNNAFVHDGTYTIRTYTNWMRNFGEDGFFKQPFYVNDQGEDTWLVNAQPTLSDNEVKLAAKFYGIDGKTSVNDLQLKVLNNKKVLTRNTVQTSSDGVMNINFTLPAQAGLKNLSIAVQDKNNKTRKALIPVKINRPQDVDIQFMPESGQFVTDIPSHIGFKALGEDGKGVLVEGIVYDNDHNELAQFSSLHNGMGAFELTPQLGKTYTAEIKLPDGSKKTVALPTPLKTGNALSVRNLMNRDTMTVSIHSTTEQSADNRYFLIGMARGVVCYGAAFKFNNNSYSARIPKALFPTGVAHLLLLNSLGQPLNERVTYIDHHDDLNIEVSVNKQRFAPRDSIPVNIEVKDGAGQPVVGSFSVAVTDDSQVKASEVAKSNIVTDMLLSSDLKGYVEDPAYYLQHNEAAWKALDALLLTQGWVGYDLKNIDKSVKPTYYPEKEFEVRGTVTNLFNKPVSNAHVVLLSKGDRNFVKDTVANKDGKFEFKNFRSFGRSTFAISATNEKGKMVNGGISIDEKNQSPANLANAIMLVPWNINTDTTVLNYVRLDKTYQESLDKYDANGHLLKAVNINDKPSVRNSKSLNGPGEADQVITEDMMVDAGKATLLDVLQNKVKNFMYNFYKDSSKKTNLAYFIRDKRVRFVFDGIDIDRFYQPITGLPNEHYDYQKQYLDNISAEDVIGIEVNYTHNTRYNINNLESSEFLTVDPTGPRGSDYAYLEITTRGGNGPFLSRATGIYIYKPLALAEYKQFYRPRYAVKTDAGKKDMRSTIHWEPNVVTNTKGMASLSFYAADKPTTYTIICEGSDLNGKVGVRMAKVTIADK